jgi:hypothetical protein
MGLGAFVRFLPVATHRLPLNDGGLFYSMTGDLLANGMRLPLMTSYNGGSIPFTYPPLGFYLAAGLHLTTGASLLDVMAWLPALIATLTIPAFYLLARRLLGRSDLASMATLAFALIPRSYEWLIMGGGITRAPGMLFALLALAAVIRLVHRPTWKDASLLGILIALTALSHLEMAWFTFFSLLLLAALSGRTRAVLARLAGALGLAALLSALWWIPLLMRHGISPFIQAAAAGRHTTGYASAILTSLTGEPYYGAFLILGILGALACLARREWLLPLWVGAILLLDPRAAGTEASVPTSLLACVALIRIVLPALSAARASARSHESPSSSRELSEAIPSMRARHLAMLVLALYGTPSAMLAFFLPGSSLASTLRPEEVETLRWIGDNTAPGRTFLIVSGRMAWEADPLSEWFPALTHHISLATPQGREWLGTLSEAGRRHWALQRCALRGLTCLESWLADDPGLEPDVILVARYPETSGIQTVALVEGLERSPEYSVIFAGSGAVAFERRVTR